jgi:DNA primase
MPIIPTEDINKIRANANIVDIISSYINLEPKGKNFFGLCPFHDDNSPSMSVSPEKQIFTCFVCGVSGNVFSFVMAYDNLEFPEAVKVVATKIGYDLKFDVRSSKRNNAHYDAMDIANKFYVNNLKSEIGKTAIKYLNERNINDEIINEFSIGVAGADNNLSKLLLGKGYDERVILDLGLANKGDDLFDVFRNRITFPINNEKGEVVAFSARIYKSEDTSKYINSKETIIFKKGHILFNYDKAKNNCLKTRTVILVEGQMDAIRIYASGIKNVVATLGTALTKEQIGLLKKLNSQVILLMDNDEAGEKTTISSGEALTNAGIDALVVRLAGEKDPDDYIAKNGVEAFEKALKTPISFFDYKLTYLKKNKDLNKADELAAYVNKIIQELNKSDDDILKEVTINDLVKEFGIEKELLMSKLTTKEKVEVKTVQEIKKKPRTTNKNKKIAEAMIYMMMNDIIYLRAYEKDLGYIPDRTYQQIANDILAYYKLHKDFIIADFISFETRSINYDEVVRILSEQEGSDFDKGDFLSFIEHIRKWTRNEQIDKLKEELKNTTDVNEKTRISDLIIKLKKDSDE